MKMQVYVINDLGVEQLSLPMFAPTHVGARRQFVAALRTLPFYTFIIHLKYTLVKHFLSLRPSGRRGAPNEKDGVAFRSHAVCIPLFSRSLDFFPDEFSESVLYFLVLFVIILLHG